MDLEEEGEIYLSNRRRFLESPETELINVSCLEYLFCVGTLLETRCFSISARNIKITEAGKHYLSVQKDVEITTVYDWNKLLVGAEVLLVHTNDPLKDYKILKARVHNTNNSIGGCPYNCTGIDLEVDEEILHDISPNRIFIPAKNSGKKSTLNVNAPEFIPAGKREN